MATTTAETFVTVVIGFSEGVGELVSQGITRVLGPAGGATPTTLLTCPPAATVTHYLEIPVNCPESLLSILASAAKATATTTATATAANNPPLAAQTAVMSLVVGATSSLASLITAIGGLAIAGGVAVSIKQHLKHQAAELRTKKSEIALQGHYLKFATKLMMNKKLSPEELQKVKERIKSNPAEKSAWKSVNRTIHEATAVHRGAKDRVKEFVADLDLSDDDSSGASAPESVKGARASSSNAAKASGTDAAQAGSSNGKR